MIMKSLILVLGLLSVSFTGCASRKAWYEKGLKEGTAQLEAAKAESYQKGYKEGFQDGVRSSSNNNNNIIVVPKGVN
jgi:flagellar biosynthesis/type III secretory pathway protein FliH